MISMVCVTIPASELVAGDWVAHQGAVVFAHSWKGKVHACIGSEMRILDPEEKLSVHLEDTGEEE